MPTRKSSGRGRLILIFGCVALVAIGIGAYRWHASAALRHESEENSMVKVSIVAPKAMVAEEDLVLPGNVRAWHEAVIYARTSGYVKNWYAPFGTHVKKGQVMAEIETPELDAQLRQAEADLKSAQANNKLAQITAKRWKTLLKSDAVSKQEADEKLGDAEAKEAMVASAMANRDHLKELVGFKLVRAPFDGVVSLRSLDIGMLVSAGVTDSQIQQPLFNVVQQDKLRIYIKVPENYSARINPSVHAELHFTEHPGEVYKANFYKSAQAIDPTTRTLEIEMVVENKDGKLFSGGYTEAHLKLPSDKTSLRLPVNTLIFRAEGLQVAVVDDTGKISLKKVTMGRDFGNEVELSNGIVAEDKVVINPPDSITNGQQVRVVEPKKETPQNAQPSDNKDKDKKDAPKDEKPGEDGKKK